MVLVIGEGVPWMDEVVRARREVLFHYRWFAPVRPARAGDADSERESARSGTQADFLRLTRLRRGARTSPTGTGPRRGTATGSGGRRVPRQSHRPQQPVGPLGHRVLPTPGREVHERPQVRRTGQG